MKTVLFILAGLSAFAQAYFTGVAKPPSGPPIAYYAAGEPVARMMAAQAAAVLPPTGRGITADQLRSSTAPPIAVLAVDTSGRFRLLRLGTGLRIADDRIEGTPTAGRLRVDRPQRTAGGYPVPSGGVLIRNGLVQTEGEDYRLDAGRAVPITPWADDDLIVVVSVQP
jgi:hypothetical protein